MPRTFIRWIQLGYCDRWIADQSYQILSPHNNMRNQTKSRERKLFGCIAYLFIESWWIVLSIIKLGAMRNGIEGELCSTKNQENRWTKQNRHFNANGEFHQNITHSYQFEQCWICIRNRSIYKATTMFCIHFISRILEMFKWAILVTIRSNYNSNNKIF